MILVSLELKYIGSNPGVDVLCFKFAHIVFLDTNLNSEVAHLLFNYVLKLLFAAPARLNM
jgi:hypothetical protein